ncbi:hypothetical protein B0H15DRAFT_1023712 [Mycena belliarum]|uniref:DUF6534 domain-containing protein n=1 Tax=Mycena belliarum TaxID=1033014 RepID=A0AAD6U4P1_9AGAR|nr:hypothetical protein B0H15DRAFT_1023712 [Mycena belliae]
MALTESWGIPVVELAGPLLVGFLLHWGLFGTLTIQLYLYYEAFPADPLFHKCLVYTLYALELVQTILITHDAFALFAFGFGDPEGLMTIHLAWLTIPVMSGLVALISQSFYSYRLWVLSDSPAMPVLIVVVALASSVGAFLVGALSHIAGNIPIRHSKANAVASGIWLGGAALADILIAVSLTFYLWKTDSRFRQTRALISRLIRITIETGSLTAVVALVNAAMIYAFPGKPYFFTAGAVVPKLYSNTILAVLNSRFRIVGGRGDSSQGMFSLESHIHTGTVRTGIPTQVAITREVYSSSDKDDGFSVELKDGSEPCR